MIYIYVKPKNVLRGKMLFIS